MFNENYDDYDFAPTSKSKLASLFRSTEDSSLTYTAPKQPKTQKNEETTKSETSVISAKVVNVWKLENNQYSLIGKYGLAIIGSLTKKEYEIILYKDKTNVITRAKITPNFTFTIKENNYGTFFDNSGQNWSIRFNTVADKDGFITDFKKVDGIVKIDAPQELPLGQENLLSKQEKSAEPPAKNDEEDAQSDSSGNRQKANILSRIAKMGQAMLPQLPTKNQSTDVSEDESEDLNKSFERTLESKQIISSKQPTTFVATMPQYDPINLYLLENRAQNSEIRMNISHISTKLDQILSKVETGSSSKENNENHLKSKIKVLELRVENLSNELEKYQEMYVNLQEELKNRKSSIKTEEEQTDQIKNYLKQLHDNENNINELNKYIEEEKLKLKSKTILLDECNKKREENEEIIKELNNKILDLEETLANIKESEKESKASGPIVEELKKSMNLMFNSIMSNFNESKDYNYSQIEAIVGQNIKNATFKIIQKYQNN